MLDASAYRGLLRRFGASAAWSASGVYDALVGASRARGRGDARDARRAGVRDVRGGRRRLTGS